MTKKLEMRDWTWQELFDFQKNTYHEGFSYELDGMPKKYRPAFAAALSVAKWSPYNSKRGSGECCMCTLYDSNCDCSTCPLKKADMDCNDDGSLFDLVRTMRRSKKNSKKAMDNLYNVLVEIYRQEWEKI